eukprot:3906309-Pyramimonas_sp.AAC.1
MEVHGVAALCRDELLDVHPAADLPLLLGVPRDLRAPVLLVRGSFSNPPYTYQPPVRGATREPERGIKILRNPVY